MHDSVAIEGPGLPSLGVFISYSRDDLAFANQLEAGLKLTNFATALDRHGIEGGEDWKQRLGSLIRDADTVVFVLSPSSAKSTICQWEVDEAERLGKRILPVICRPLDTSVVPRQLAALDYIFFYPEPKSPDTGFGTGLTRLVGALKADHVWLREHTRLLQRALEWAAAGRNPGRLLFGDSVEEAKSWIARRPRHTSEPTALQIEFIRSSENAEVRRRDAERLQLEEIAKAQAAREQALRQAEFAHEQNVQAQRRIVRIIKVSAALGILVAAIGALIGWLTQEHRQREALRVEAHRTDIVGQVVAYATARGQPALETRKGSVYAENLVEFLSHKDKGMLQSLVELTDYVVHSSGGVQRPFISSSINGSIFLWQQPQSRSKIAYIISVEQSFAGRPLLSIRDADKMAKLLNLAGFSNSEIVRLHNPTRKVLVDMLSAAKPSKKQNNLLIFYFSGDGVAFGPKDYIVLVEPGGKPYKRYESQSDLQCWALDAVELAKAVDRLYAASIFILDTNFPVLGKEFPQGGDCPIGPLDLGQAEEPPRPTGFAR
jgi:hypothetical protein